MESGYFNNGNFREYSYLAGEFCSLETGIPSGPVSELSYGVVIVIGSVIFVQLRLVTDRQTDRLTHDDS